MRFKLSQDEVQLLHFMVEQPDILIANGRKAQNQKGDIIPIGIAYPVDDRPAARKNFIRLRQWMQKKVYTKKVGPDNKVQALEMLPVTVSLKQAGLDFLLDVLEHYKTTCSVMPWVSTWTHLDYKLRNNGAELEVDDFEEDIEQNESDKN